jgi:hypothetical protein
MKLHAMSVQESALFRSERCQALFHFGTALSLSYPFFLEFLRGKIATRYPIRIEAPERKPATDGRIDSRPDAFMLTPLN